MTFFRKACMWLRSSRERQTLSLCTVLRPLSWWETQWRTFWIFSMAHNHRCKADWWTFETFSKVSYRFFDVPISLLWSATSKYIKSVKLNFLELSKLSLKYWGSNVGEGAFHALHSVVLSSLLQFCLV